MRFKEEYFTRFKFTGEQVNSNLKNAIRDLEIAGKVDIAEVKFNYAYTALIKAGIALLSARQIKVKSSPGHHIRIIEEISRILNDASVATIGNIMRSKRNLDFYSGGIEVSEKECREFLHFVEQVVAKVKAIILTKH